METLPLFFFFFFFFTNTASSANAFNCKPSSCGTIGPDIRFPFRLTDRQTDRCGYPGFDLSCNNLNQTLLTLPSSGEFIVNRISYGSQAVYINPQFCLPDRIFTFSLRDTPFEDSLFLWSYTFFNCSSQYFDLMYPAVPFPCLSGNNYTIIAMPSGFASLQGTPPTCRNISQISVPVRRYIDIVEEIVLTWYTPFCRACESEGRNCGIEDDGEIVCSHPASRAGLPRSAKYGIIIGMGIPALVCFIGLVCFTGTKIREYSRRPNGNIDLFSITITPRPANLTGLDGATIASYPKTVLGESRRLPKPNDGTCPICLSDYQPKETLRTIPECNHYFHADCIDEWLRLNATCPVCRNSPSDSSLGITPCSSMSSPSSS